MASARYQYHVVPFIGRISGSSFSSDNAATVSDQLRAIITQQSAQGWEFYSVEKIGIEVQPGCLGSLMGSKTAYLNFDQVVFRKEG